MHVGAIVSSSIRITHVAAAVTLIAAVAMSGCTKAPEPDDSTNLSGAAPDPQQVAYGQCITKALNEAVLKSQNTQATLASMDGQTLNGCPTDFVEGFVKLRTAVRTYTQTLEEIEAHKKQQDAAVGFDAANLVCSVFSGAQCAQSSIKDWLDDDDNLKARDAENRAAIQSAYDALEGVAAHYNIYVSVPKPSDAANSAENPQ